MIQCQDCEFFVRDESGRIMLRCDPFSTIKEPACLEKWQLLRLDGLLQAYQTTLRWYQKLAPLQEKMFDYMRREMEDLDEADRWKYTDEEPQDDTDDQKPPPDERP
jgi:hypothetical protein